MVVRRGRCSCDCVLGSLAQHRGCAFGHGVFEFGAECLQCCLVGRRVGVGCVEGLCLVCSVSVHRVFVPVKSAVSFVGRFIG